IGGEIEKGIAIANCAGIAHSLRENAPFQAKLWICARRVGRLESSSNACGGPHGRAEFFAQRKPLLAKPVVQLFCPLSVEQFRADLLPAGGAHLRSEMRDEPVFAQLGGSEPRSLPAFKNSFLELCHYQCRNRDLLAMK